MIVSVVNHTSGLISDSDLQAAIRAVNRQLSEDFDLHWGMPATLRLEGRRGTVNGAEAIVDASNFSGEAVIYVWHPVEVSTALGFHARTHLGMPYGFVFPEVARQLGEPWTAALSHEALEIVADPEVNLMVMGPHPADPLRTVFHWYEICDAVQKDSYLIDGVPVSNFLLPPYFTHADEPGSRNDFLGQMELAPPLPSFGVSPGGYVGFFDPLLGEHVKFFAESDLIARRRLSIKQQLGLARRSVRYEFRTVANSPITAALRRFI